MRHRFLNWRCQAKALIEVGLFSTLLIGTGKTPIRPEIVSRRGQVKTRTLADFTLLFEPMTSLDRIAHECAFPTSEP